MTTFGKRGTNHASSSPLTRARMPIWVYGLLLAGVASLIVVLLTKEPASPKAMGAFACEYGAPASGAIIGVRGADGHTLRYTPGGEPIINRKASEMLGEPHHHVIDNSTMVQLQCIDGEWARVQITEPEWLRFAQGWVKRAALDERQSPDGFRTFTDEHFHWDKDTAKEKEGIIKAVNRLHREDARCAKSIVPASVAKSATETSRRGVPVYFINCTGRDGLVNVYFVAE